MHMEIQTIPGIYAKPCKSGRMRMLNFTLFHFVQKGVLSEEKGNAEPVGWQSWMNVLSAFLNS